MDKLQFLVLITVNSQLKTALSSVPLVAPVRLVGPTAFPDLWPWAATEKWTLLASYSANSDKRHYFGRVWRCYFSVFA